MELEREALEQEARYLHARFFGRPLPEVVVARYVDANQLCFPNLSGRDRALLRQVIASRLDPEALELVLRWRKRTPVLTRKIQILFYLLEVRSEYYPYFVNQKPGRARAVAHLALALLRTAWKAVKGAVLVWRYGFV